MIDGFLRGDFIYAFWRWWKNKWRRKEDINNVTPDAIGGEKTFSFWVI